VTDIDTRIAKDGSRIPTSPCVSCGEPNDAASRVNNDDVRPGPGDVTICAYCGHIAVYADDMTLRDPNDAEIIDMAGEPEVLHAQKVAKAYRDWKNARRANER
jgi:hypothetical protein